MTVWLAVLPMPTSLLALMILTQLDVWLELTSILMSVLHAVLKISMQLTAQQEAKILRALPMPIWKEPFAPFALLLMLIGPHAQMLLMRLDA